MSKLCCGRQDVETKHDNRELSRTSGDQKLENKETKKVGADREGMMRQWAEENIGSNEGMGKRKETQLWD